MVPHVHCQHIHVQSNMINDIKLTQRNQEITVCVLYVTTSPVTDLPTIHLLNNNQYT